MKNIVVAVDFSTIAANAARYAVQLAEFYNTGIWIYHSYEVPVTASDMGYPFISSPELQNLADFEMQELVKELSGISKQPVNISSRVELTNLSDGLYDFCNEVKAGMLVMGITGKNALQRLLIGSNTLHAIQQLHCPVLVVPGEANFSAFKKIGLAVDYENPVSAAAITFVKSVVNVFNSSLYVVNVDWNDRHYTEASKQQQAWLRQELTTGEVHFRSLQNEHMATAIHDFVETEEIDLLITLPKKHNLAERLFAIAHTPGLLHHTSVPVLCIPE